MSSLPLTSINIEHPFSKLYLLFPIEKFNLLDVGFTKNASDLVNSTKEFCILYILLKKNFLPYQNHHTYHLNFATLHHDFHVQMNLNYLQLKTQHNIYLI